MDSAGHPAQQALGRLRRLPDEVVHIVPAGKVQVAAQLAVERVFDRHIHDHAALIHHGVQLGAHFLGGAVDTGQNAGAALCFRMELISAGRCVDLGAPCPQKSHVAHHDLAGYAQLSGQGTGTDRLGGPGQP